MAEANGKKYFLGQDTNGGQVCLFTVAFNGSEWNAGCAAATEGELLKTGRGPDQESAIVVSDSYDTKELESGGWTKVHHNVLVSGG